jgi:hypothetical protein
MENVESLQAMVLAKLANHIELSVDFKDSWQRGCHILEFGPSRL